MSIPCKQILIAMFTFTMPVAADEPDELLKLKIGPNSRMATADGEWREVFWFIEGYDPTYVSCQFKNYFYDQFADAADIPHIIPGSQEFLGGMKFDEIGAWGRSIQKVECADDAKLHQ